MSTEIDLLAGPAPYDDEEEILLMDTDQTNLQLEEPPVIETIVKVNHQEEDEEEERTEVSPVLVIEVYKLKVYIRDGPNSNHVETVQVDDKYYDFSSTDQLSSIGLTEESLQELLQSLNISKEDFRTSSSPNGTSRPESLYVRGVTNMSTQEILNYFEEYQPIGIAWVCDHSCNVFWHDTLTPLQLLVKATAPGPCIPRRDSDHSVRSSKRKHSSLTSTDNENGSVEIALPPGHWREGHFQSAEKTDSSVKLYLRYTTLNDRKVRGAENQSEYYRQYGNPNYNNMTGLISRSKKRALNAMRSDRFRDFTVVKSNDRTLTSNTIVEESSTAGPDDSTADDKVKFTVVLPPKKTSPSPHGDHEDEDEDGHRSKRQRRRRSSDDDEDRRRREDKTHFTVTIDPVSKHKIDSRDHPNDGSTSKKRDDDDHSTPVTDARQLLQRLRRNRK